MRWRPDSVPSRTRISALTIDAVLHRQPVPPRAIVAELPPELEEIIIKALEKNRDLRYLSAAELRIDLQQLRQDTDSGA